MRAIWLTDLWIMKITQIALGSQGLVVPVIGLGCMGMTGFEEAHMYGPADEREAIATIHRSLELGGNFLDTADLYGPLKNEQLISKAISGKRDQYILATKFGWEIDDNNKVTWAINGKKDYVKKSLERSLKHLNTDYIDLFHEKLIVKAKEKLSTTNLSVSEIAYAPGFEHAQSFSTLFKKKTNLSPLEFRQALN